MLDYYKTAATASQQIGNHHGLQRLAALAQKASNILDVGCGEGTRLHTIAPNRIATGVDTSNKAIKLAKKKYPNNTFVISDAAKLPWPDDSFDLVYSAFVLEHTHNPQQVVNEIIRVCKTNGKIVLLCPNFGAPNRRSPNSIQPPFKKLLSGLLNDFVMSGSNLCWQKVTPKVEYNQIDDDTTIEPYILSLVSYLKFQGLNIIESSSMWMLEDPSRSPRKLLFKILGQMKLFPFKYWGPQIFIEAQK